MELKERISKILCGVRIFHIVVVGCGGTGSNLVPHLAQLVYSITNQNQGNRGRKAKVKITLVDQDVIEPKNVGRQLFINREVGENKAAVLQQRYGNNFGLDIDYSPHYIRDEEMLLKLLSAEVALYKRKGYKVMPILVSCVDNHFSRQIFHRVFNSGGMKDLIYLDAGNSLYAGQVVMGMKYQGEVLTKPVAEYYPDVLTTQDEIEIGGTCTQKVEKEPQTLVANLWAASTLLSYLNNILIERKVPAYMATFNAHNTLVKPEYII